MSSRGYDYCWQWAYVIMSGETSDGEEYCCCADYEYDNDGEHSTGYVPENQENYCDSDDEGDVAIRDAGVEVMPVW